MEANYESIRKEMQELTLSAQKESEKQRIKYESRRTALQIAERTCRSQDGNKGDSAEVIVDAELIYQWLIGGLLD